MPSTFIINFNISKRAASQKQKKNFATWQALFLFLFLLFHFYFYCRPMTAGHGKEEEQGYQEVEETA